MEYSQILSSWRTQATDAVQGLCVADFRVIAERRRELEKRKSIIQIIEEVREALKTG